MAGDVEQGRPTPLASLRTSFSTLWAKAAMYPSQSTLHKLRSLDRAQLSRSIEASIPSATAMRRRRSRR